MWVCVCRNQSFHHYPCRPRHTEVGSGCLGAVGLGEMWRSEALALSFPCVFCRVSSILQMARFWSSVKTIPMVLLQRSSHVSASGWFCGEGELGRTDVSVLLLWEEKPIFVFSKPDFGFCWHSFGSSFLGGAVHDPTMTCPGIAADGGMARSLSLTSSACLTVASPPIGLRLFTAVTPPP